MHESYAILIGSFLLRDYINQCQLQSGSVYKLTHSRGAASNAHRIVQGFQIELAQSSHNFSLQESFVVLSFSSQVERNTNSQTHNIAIIPFRYLKILVEPRIIITFLDSLYLLLVIVTLAFVLLL